MLKRIEDLNFYELLEVPTDANVTDIHRAYDRVRKVYEPNSIALYSLLSQEETERIRHRIDEAYRTLIYDETRREYDRILRDRHELPELPPPKPKYQPRPAPVDQQPVQVREITPPENVDIPLPESVPSVLRPAPAAAVPPVQMPPAAIEEFTGPVIKLIRESKGLSIQNVADITKVSARHIHHIEEELYLKLPPRPYLRGFLAIYAKALGYAPEKFVNDYMKRYEASTGVKKRSSLL